MSDRRLSIPTLDAGAAEAAAQLRQAASARKCWQCGCLHDTLAAVERALPQGRRPAELDEALRAAREPLAQVRYDCLGCEVCYPALAVNALNQAAAEPLVELEPCPTEQAAERAGWPPLPGSYTVLRYQAPVAVCTLTDDGLATSVAKAAGPEIAVVGTMQTENLGVERLVRNVLANPNIRSVVVCGPDTRQAVGHLPGQSLLALARSGVDDRGRIVGAKGKRPVLKNVSREAVEHFRRTVEVVDLVGDNRLPDILDAARSCAARNPGPADPFSPENVLTPAAGYLPERLTLDPAGYFVLYPDRPRRLLVLEHYRNNGVLNAVIEGRTAAELYVPAIDKGLVSRLDHAAYLGKELARAEQALSAGGPYVQDAAPERPAPQALPTSCGCRSSCS